MMNNPKYIVIIYYLSYLLPYLPCKQGMQSEQLITARDAFIQKIYDDKWR